MDTMIAPSPVTAGLLDITSWERLPAALRRSLATLAREIDGPEFVSIQTYPGMMMTTAGERVTGRHDTTKTRLRAVVQFADGSQNRNPLEGFVTDSARDAVLWASELASSGNFRRALEIPHAVLTTAFAQHG